MQIIITADANEKRLVLSAKEIARENAVLEHSQKISKLAVGETVSGKIVRMESYGVFIEIGEDLIGLCHISQITNKFIKSPKEVVKLGDTVSAKIIALDGDRISLSMKALENVFLTKKKIHTKFQTNFVQIRKKKLMKVLLRSCSKE